MYVGWACSLCVMMSKDHVCGSDTEILTVTETEKMFRNGIVLVIVTGTKLLFEIDNNRNRSRKLFTVNRY